MKFLLSAIFFFFATPALSFTTCTTAPICTTSDGVLLDNQRTVRFYESGGDDYAELKAPASLSAPYSLTLPLVADAAGESLTSGGSGALSWVAMQPTSEKDQANGYAGLDGGGKVLSSVLPAAIMTYEGTWNALTNTPTLSDSTCDAGMVYRVNVSGTQNLGSGAIIFVVGDYAICNSSLIWEQSDTTDAVASVNGMTGVVSLTTTDIPEGSNLYFTTAAAKAAAVADTITNGVTDVAPSQNAVFDALALKGPAWVATVRATAGGTYTAASYESVAADTTGGTFTVNLKASPVAGDLIEVLDYAGTWDTFPLTIGRNSSLINGLAADFTADLSNGAIQFLYVDGTQGWKVK